MKRLLKIYETLPKFLTYLCVFLFSFFASTSVFSQVGINTTTPDPSAVLDVSASDKGILVPRVSLTNVTQSMLDGTNTAATGLMIYNTNASTTGGNGVGFYVFNGTAWNKVTTTADTITDADFYEEGTTNAPDAITDDMYTQGNVAIGQNTADYPLDISSTLERGINIAVPGTANTNFTGINTQIDNSGNGNHIGIRNDISGNGTGFKTGVLNLLSNNNNTATYGVNNVINNNSNSGFHYGTANTIAGTGNGVYYGSFNSIANFGTGTKYGSYSRIFNVAGGDHYAVYAEALRTTGTTFAGYFLGNVGIGTTTSNTYTLPTSRGTVDQIMQTDGSGNVSWVNTTALNDDDFYAEGTSLPPTSINDDIYRQGNIAIGQNTADYPLDISSTAQRAINISVNGSSSTDYAVHSQLTGTGNGFQYGALNFITNTGNGVHYGVYNSLSGNGNGSQIGVYNNMPNTGTGDKYGTYNRLGSNVNANLYGTYNQITGGLGGNKYGTYINILPGAQGNHYGLYSEVLRPGGFAGYFLGSVSIGTTTTTNYILPADRGTADQIMQTDGSGNVSWINATDLNDHDFYREGTTNPPTSINDDIYTQGNVAIGRNTAGYPLDIASTSQRAINISVNGSSSTDYGTYTEVTGIGTGFQYGALNFITNTGDGAHFGIYNTLGGTGNGNQFGLYNNMPNTGTGNKYGTYNRLGSSANANLYGTFNQITSGLGGNKYGTYINILPGVQGNHYGLYSEVLRSGSFAGYFLGSVSIGTTTTTNYILPADRGTADQIMQTDGSGNVNWVNPTALNDHDFYAEGTTLPPTNISDDIYTQGNVAIGKNTADYNLDINETTTTRTINLYNSNTSGITSGIFNEVTGNNNDTQRGVYNLVGGGGNASRMGVYNNMGGSGSGSVYGTFNSISTSGTGVQYGTRNEISGIGTGQILGVSTNISNSSDSGHVGTFNTLSGSGDGSHYGYRNLINGDGNGLKIGYQTLITSDGNGTHRSFSSNITGSGTGDKYGADISISTGAGGTHYGIHSEVLKTGSYAGYFLGTLYVGTTTTNGYNLPATDGTIGQIMQTDGSGVASWVDAPASYWARTGTNLDVANANDDIQFSSDQTTIRFPAPGATPSPMIQMFTSGTTNTARMVVAHSPTFDTWGLEYRNSGDSFVFRTATTDIVEIDLNGGFPLRVYGRARAEDFQSDTTNYPDYVFEKYYEGHSKLDPTYNFQSLTEVEQFIIEKGHLPGVKSYEEVEAAGMTLNLTETTVQNLEKIEELFLYAIELKKENETLKEAHKTLEERLQKLEKLLIEK